MTAPIQLLDQYPSYCKMAASIYNDLAIEISLLKTQLQTSSVNISVVNNNAIEDVIEHRAKIVVFEALETMLYQRAYTLQEIGDNPP